MDLVALSSDNCEKRFSELRSANKVSELQSMLVAMLPDLGWRYFLLSEVERRRGGAVLDLLAHLPADLLLEGADLLADAEVPVHRLCSDSTVVKWTDIPYALPAGRSQAAFLQSAKQHGLVYGLTLSVPSFGGGKILFSVWRPDPPDVGYGEQVMSQNLALAIARRVTELNDLETVRNMEGRLTKRQISCVGLISRGFSDQQIAELLEISAETVKEHVSEARLRLGVRRRTELVYKLTRAGLII